jgi:hypothetical protein
VRASELHIANASERDLSASQRYLNANERHLSLPVALMIIDAGAVPSLVRLLEGRGGEGRECREAAAGALHALLSEMDHRRAFDPTR